MKKVVLASTFALIGVVLFSSCKKDWTCECTVFGVTWSYVIEDHTKKDAEAECEGESNNACTLK